MLHPAESWAKKVNKAERCNLSTEQTVHISDRKKIAHAQNFIVPNFFFIQGFSAQN